MRGFCAAVCFGCSLLAATVCRAATVQPLHGQISVNQGQGFHQIDGAADLKAGDSVIVSPGGTATVSYPDGCNIGLQPGAVMVIAALSPCASGSYAQEQDSNWQDHKDDDRAWIIGGVLVGVGSLLGYEIFHSTQNNHQGLPQPASP
jgi:hypothetical protein